MARPFFCCVLSVACTYEPVLASNWRLSYFGGLAVQDKYMGANICRLNAKALVVVKDWEKNLQFIGNDAVPLRGL